MFLRLDMKIKFGSGLAGLPSTYFHTEIFFFFLARQSRVTKRCAQIKSLTFRFILDKILCAAAVGNAGGLQLLGMLNEFSCNFVAGVSALKINEGHITIRYAIVRSSYETFVKTQINHSVVIDHPPFL